MINPIVEREFIGILRTRKAFALQVGFAVLLTGIVLMRWPSEARVSQAGIQSRQVLQLFAYGLTSCLLLLIPIFPATTIVREKRQGTLALLLNSPLRPHSIYLGKLTGIMGTVLLLLILSLPAAAACYAMGGVSFPNEILPLYLVLAVMALQFIALGMLVSSYASTPDSALRITFALVFAIAIVSMVPHLFLQGQGSALAGYAELLRSISPMPAIMEIIGHKDVGSQGNATRTGVPQQYLIFSALATLVFSIATIFRLNHQILDQSRSQGVITEERGLPSRIFRRLVFLVDPQRRRSGIPPFVNPVMVKEFRTRRFGRSHWNLRLIAGCALISLVLTYFATTGTMEWGVETIGGIMVLLQVALIVLLTPSFAAGLISGERESGCWELLKMTPLSIGVILRGKIMSVVWTLLLILCATLPGYLFMIYISPPVAIPVLRVVTCLLFSAAFTMIASITISSFVQRTATAMAVTYAVLLPIFAGTLLVWLGRDAPFGRSTVQAALRMNPMAAALTIIEAPGFEGYDLLPATWWISGGASVCLLLVLMIRTWRLTRPD